MTTATQQPHEVSPENARKFIDWLANRGGILIWHSCNLSRPGHSVSTPALTTEGEPYPRPGWEFSQHTRHITSIEDIVVSVPKEEERFEVRLKIRGHKLELMKRSTNKVDHAMSCYPDGWWVFASTGSQRGDLFHGLSCGTDTVIIYSEAGRIPLKEWAEKNQPKDTADERAE